MVLPSFPASCKEAKCAFSISLLGMTLLSKLRMTWTSQGSSVGNGKENSKALFFINHGGKRQKNQSSCQPSSACRSFKNFKKKSSSTANETVQEEMWAAFKAFAQLMSATFASW